jgi:cyclase
LLLDKNTKLIKTIKFSKPTYLGDPLNAVRIFNEKEVDELLIIDIEASTDKRAPNYQKINDIVSEAFMPIGYGGGVNSLEIASKVIECGVEKVAINSAIASNPDLITEIANVFGSQSVVVSVDVKKNLFGNYHPYILRGGKKVDLSLIDYVKMIEDKGAGEIILTNISREGTYQGYDIELIKQVTSRLSIPIIALGGASSLDDFYAAIQEGGASAVAAGSKFVYSGNERGILINYPKQNELIESIYKKIK